MSDNLTLVESVKFNSKVEINSPSPNLKRSFLQNSPIAISVEVSNSFLNELRLVQAATNFSHIDIVNTQITGFQLKSSERLQSRLYQLCYRVSSNLKKIKGGRQKQGFLNEKVKIAVYQNELFNVQELSQSVQKFSTENVKLLQKCSDLYDSLQKAHGDCTEVQFEINQLIMNEVCHNKTKKSLHTKIDQLSSNLEILQTKYEEKQKENDDLSYDKKCAEIENQQLLDYIQSLEKNMTKESNSQTNYSLRSFKSEASKALWFAEAYGLLPHTIKCTSKTGKNVNFSLNSSFRDLDQENKHHVRQLLFILDKFAISDAAYYELSAISPDLPRKYLIIQERANLNKLFHIERSPGNTPGAYVKIKDEIMSFLLSSEVDNVKPVKVKVSGDGANVSRISNFVTVSLTFPDEDHCSSVYNVRAIGVFKCKESYDELGSCCAPIFQELNELLRDSEITVQDKKYRLDIFFGGDMKFTPVRGVTCIKLTVLTLKNHLISTIHPKCCARQITSVKIQN